MRDGLAHVAGAWAIKRERVLGSAFTQRYGFLQVTPGGLEARQEIRSVAAAMRDDLRSALEAFADGVE